MSKLQIPKNRINSLLKQLSKFNDPDELEHGWSLYHKGQVVSVHPNMEALRVEAVVQDEEIAKVTLNLAKFDTSKCTCNTPNGCEHIAAVVFALYAAHGRPELLLQELKLLAAKKPRAVKSRSDQLNKKSEEPLETGTSDDWQSFFDMRFYGFAISHSYTFDMFAAAVSESLSPFANSWSQSKRQLYLLNIVIFTLRKIEEFYLTSQSSYLSSYHETSCKLAISYCQDKLSELTGELQTAKAHSLDERSWHNMLRLLGKTALQGKESPIDWLYFYRRIWSALSGHNSWVQTEITRLDDEISKQSYANVKPIKAQTSKLPVNPLKQDVLLLARAHFEVMADQIDVAHQLLSGLHKRVVSDYYVYLEHYAKDQQWDSMLKWLRWLYPVMNSAPPEDFRVLCQYWTEAAKHTNTDHEWVQTMEALLPRSYYYYTSYLLQSKRYRQWIDLQLATRVSPVSLYALELRAVEEYEPRLLLPLYHQAIERAVLEKNRASYKTALNLLDKLAEYYRLLGMSVEWMLFIQELSNKFSRLRAFQDELKKGRWMS